MDFQAHITAFGPINQGQHGLHLFILFAGDTAHIGLTNQLGQGDIPRKLEMRSLRSRHGSGSGTGYHRGSPFAEALGRIDRFIDRGDHLTDRNLARGQTEAIAATGATYAAHQTMFAQTGKQLFQIGQGDAWRSEISARGTGPCSACNATSSMAVTA